MKKIEIGKEYTREELGQIGIHCIRQMTCGVSSTFVEGKRYDLGIRGNGNYALLGIVE